MTSLLRSPKDVLLRYCNSFGSRNWLYSFPQECRKCMHVCISRGNIELVLNNATNPNQRQSTRVIGRIAAYLAGGFILSKEQQAVLRNIQRT